jgi:hypothetical protein
MKHYAFFFAFAVFLLFSSPLFDQQRRERNFGGAIDQVVMGIPKPNQDTGKAEPRFKTYEEAMRYIRRTYRGERINTSRSSWITNAEYYPAQGRGYLIIGMNGKDYLFAAVPTEIWDGFKNAPSLGTYYNRYIKGRYTYKL